MNPCHRFQRHRNCTPSPYYVYSFLQLSLVQLSECARATICSLGNAFRFGFCCCDIVYITSPNGTMGNISVYTMRVCACAVIILQYTSPQR
jgi:hypothetical protein